MDKLDYMKAFDAPEGLLDCFRKLDPQTKVYTAEWFEMLNLYGLRPSVLNGELSFQKQGA